MGQSSAANSNQPRSSAQPVEIDIVSALYPNRSVTASRLLRMLESKAPCGSKWYTGSIVFRIEKKDLERFEPQLSESFAELESTGDLDRLGNPTWSIRILEDIDHASYLEQLSRKLGKGGVSDADMERVSKAWASGNAR